MFVSSKTRYRAEFSYTERPSISDWEDLTTRAMYEIEFFRFESGRFSNSLHCPVIPVRSDLFFFFFKR